MNNELRYSMCSKVHANLIIRKTFVMNHMNSLILKAHEIHVIFYIYTWLYIQNFHAKLMKK